MKKIFMRPSVFIPILVIALSILVAVGVVPAPGIGEKEFLVKAFSPQGEVRGRTKITAVFNRDVVSADGTGSNLTVSDMPFTFSPSVSGSGKWENSRTFVFYPKAGLLQSATAYTATARVGLRDSEGRLLSGPQSFSFNTAPLSFLGARQVNFDPNMNAATYELKFSLPVSPAKLRGYTDVTDGSGAALDYRVQQGPVSRLVRINVSSRANVKDVLIKLAKGLPSEEGMLGLETQRTVRVSKKVKMEILDSNAMSNINNGEIYIGTTAPVDFARAPSFIEVSPKVAYNFEPRDSGFAITGDFAPQDRIKVTLRKGFPSFDGKALESEWSRAFIFPEKKAELKFAAPGSVISPAGSLRIPIETVNVDRVHILVWKLYENNIPIGMRSAWSEYPIDLSSMTADKTYKVNAKRNKAMRSALDLKPLIGGEKGVFLVIAQNEEGDWTEDRQVVNVTDLGITVKKGPDSAQFWVNSVKTGKSVSDAKVTLWTWSNQSMAEGSTNGDGLASLAMKDAGETPVLATVKKGGDVAFVRLDNGLFGGKDTFGINGEQWVSKGYAAYCYMPRDIFRPGETVPMRAVFRDPKGVAPQPFPAIIKVYSPLGKLWTRQSGKLTKEGVLSGVIRIPVGAPTGTWSVTVSATDSAVDIAGSKEFFVEEFAAPRLFVEAAVKQKKVIGGGNLDYSMSAVYVFGSPAAGLKGEIEMSAQEKEFRPKGWKGYIFTDVEKKFRPSGALAWEGVLDKEGKRAGTLKAPDITAPSMAEITLRTGVMEEGGRWVYKTASVPWYPHDVMVGIAPPRAAEPGKKLKFSAAAVTPDGAAAQTKRLKYTFLRVVRRAVTYEQGGRSASRSQEDFIQKGSGEISLKNGAASFSVLPGEGGRYIVRVEDPVSGARASQWVYVYGGETEDETPLPDNVKITTDKKSYRVGETAKVKVTVPFAGRLLLNVETYRVVLSKAVAVSGKEAEVKIRVTEEMAPNAWLTAQVIRAVPADNSPARAYGAAALMLDNSQKRLTVEIKEPGRIKPGENKFSLTVKDGKGGGVESNVTVMLVDEAILGLTGFETPDPWKYFTAQKTLGVETYDLYNALIRAETPKTPLLIPGGGADGAALNNSSLNPVQAKRFKMLSLAKTVRSDAKGVCSFTFVLPEFAGKARLMAVAVTANASGSGSRPVDINRDMVVEPSMPRILAPGDEIKAPCSVFNKKDKSENVSLEIETSGPVKLLGNPVMKAVIAPDGSVSFPLSFKALGTGVAKVSYIARWKGGALRSSMEIAVRPAAPRVHESGSFVVDPGKKVTMDIPRQWFAGTFRGSVMLSAMPTVSLAELADFLITYPHGCMEQTVSSAWPLLFQSDIVKAADPSLADDKAVRGALTKRIERIMGLQNYDGGFVRWQGETWSQPWETIYGAHFLIEAKKAGVKVSEDNLRAALTYIRRQLSSVPEDRENDVKWREALTRRAYSCYVLALAGDAPLGWMESLRDRASSLDPSGRLFLASAYAVSGQKKEAAKMLDKKLETMNRVPGGNDNYDSDLRSSALSLLAYAHTAPRGADAAAAASSLLNKIKRAKYYSTQESGMSFLALAKYFHAQPTQGTPAGSLTAGGNVLAELSAAKRTAKAQVKLPEPVTAVNTGKARLFAAWVADGVPTVPVKNHDNGITVRVKLAGRDGKTAARIERGAALTASITVTPRAGKLREVVVSMPLPAGLEIEKAAFQQPGEPVNPNVRAEARDDRLLLYISRLDKPLVWRTALRAVTEGTFAVPQTSAECMYDPAVSSVTGGGKVNIYSGR